MTYAIARIPIQARLLRTYHRIQRSVPRYYAAGRPMVFPLAREVPRLVNPRSDPDLGEASIEGAVRH